MRARLMLLLLTAATILIVLTAVITYRIARQQVDVIFDYHLRQVALSIAGQVTNPALPGFHASNPELDLVIQIWTREGVTIYFSPPLRALPNRTRPGYVDATTADGSWRVFALQQRDRTIQVAQPLWVRQQYALSAAMRIIVPSLLLLPALAAGIWIAVGRGLRPLSRLAAALARRKPDDAGPVTLPSPPAEIAPLLSALNDLLTRLDKTMSAQRAFVADAAHQLRTPLTALRLQAQLVERATDPAERAGAVRDLRQGLDRMTRVVEQLLTLARQEPDASAPAQPLDLSSLARETITNHVPIATARGLDLGAAPLDEGVRVMGDPPALTTMLDNLLDNAIRYTPSGGQIDVAVGIASGQPFVEVSDSGPGVAADDRPHVFERFYRGRDTREPGSGLGLAIAKLIADRHRATIRLDDSPLGGLAVRVMFPPVTLPQ